MKEVAILKCLMKISKDLLNLLKNLLNSDKTRNDKIAMLIMQWLI